ncbi:MAG TPA: ATP-binding protein [Bryobacteraceae bacterium]|nr:ATP-binding protein [Bryobacteraceae bacterium]
MPVRASLTRAYKGLLTSSRAVLSIGFGGLLILMIVIAISANRAVARIEAGNVGIRREFLDRDHLLHRLRSDLYQYSLGVRDYLLNTDPRVAEQRRTEVLKTETEMDTALQKYGQNLPRPETAAVKELQRDLQLYYATIEPVLHWDAPTRDARGNEFISTQMLPRHEQLVRMAERISAMDSRQLLVGEAHVASVFAGFRRELMLTALAILLFGAALAWLSIARVEALERESDCRYREVVTAREELHRLSSRLVAAQEEERRKLSRELHDEIGAAMSALLMEMGSLDSALPPGDTALHERVQAVRKLAENNVGLVRNLSLLLRPPMLDDLGLVPALKWKAREVARRTGIKIRVEAEEVSDDLPDEHRTCIFRVVQEALHNATRHAGASHVRIQVRQEATQIHVQISDDGTGFEPRLEKGVGILGMEERVRNLGGKLHIESAPGRGARLSFELPLEQPVPVQPA